MGYDAIHYAYFKSKVDGVPRVILAALALYAGMDNRCFGSAARLSRMTGFNKRTVIRALRVLQDAGELVLEGKGGILADGTFEANRWFFPNVVIADREEGDRRLVTESHQPSDRESLGLVTESHPIERVKGKKEERQSPQAAPVMAGASPRPADAQNCNPSLPSEIESNKGSAKSTKFDPLAIPLPHGPRFRHVWGEWVQHRKEKRAALTPLATSKQLKELATLNEEAAMECIANSIKNGWSGLFPDRYTKGGQPQGDKPKNVIKAFVPGPFSEELAELHAAACGA